MKTFIRNFIWKEHIFLQTLSISLFFPVMCFAQNLLQGPQKIVIDKERNRYIVSNWSGGGDLVSIDSLGNQSYFVEKRQCFVP